MIKQQYAHKRKSNIVPIKVDASFYCDRAMKSLNRLKYQKAVRYFRKAIELEPDNGSFYCSLAMAFAEMEKFEESNRLLWHVLEKISPSMFECYFYLASNYANMMDFELAEQYALKYLEKCPTEEWAEEAEDLLDFIAMELERPSSESEMDEDLEVTALHDRARNHLEEGRFTEARGLLERIVKEFPDFQAARNNLALCYYYMGYFGKAMETVQEVLQDDPYNIHALCNLAVFYYHLHHEDYPKVMDFLRKLAPFHLDQTYKLATTLGILEEHEAAYKLFRKLISYSGYGDLFILHYGAVAAFNAGRLNEAESLWKRVQRMDPAGVVAPFYLDEIKKHHEGDSGIQEASYHYQLMEKEQELSVDEWKEEMVKDPLIRSSFLWALRFGDKNTKMQVIRAFEFIPDKELEHALRLFLLNPAEDEELKKLTVAVLQKMGVQGTFMNMQKLCKNNFDDSSEKISLDSMEKWQKVLHCLREKMETRFPDSVIEEARLMWLEFMDCAYPNSPTIRKVPAWAASVEYLIAKKSEVVVTREGVANHYGVSVATLDRNCKLIRETLQSGSDRSKA